MEYNEERVNNSYDEVKNVPAEESLRAVPSEGRGVCGVLMELAQLLQG